MNIRKALLTLCAASVLAFALATPAMAATQTLTILGGNGSYGDKDPYSEYTLDGGSTWHQAYLSGTATSATTGYCYHPWGYVAGTNCWINQSPDDTVGTGISESQPKTTLYRVRFYVPQSANTTTATATIDMLADNHADVSVNNVPMASFDSSFNGAATKFSSAVKPGQVNEIEISLTDWGGITGFNYSIVITMDANQPLTVLPASSSPAGAAMATATLGRTPWQEYRTGTLYTLPKPSTAHGAQTDYVYANIPTKDAGPADANGVYPSTNPWVAAPSNAIALNGWHATSGWVAPTNPDTIGFSITSQIPSAPSPLCLDQADYSYFQTFVTVPLNTAVTAFTISFPSYHDMDDGSRISIFNSAYPNGIIVPNSYVYLWQPGTSDLSSYIVPGVNRIVITQVDDCGGGNNLQDAEVVLNGKTVASNTPPTADAGGPYAGECTDTNGTGLVTLNGSGSDKDGDKLSYAWAWSGGSASIAGPTDSFPLGSTPVTLTVDDGHGYSASASSTVTVSDTQAPSVSASLVPVHVHGHEGTFQVSFSAVDACDPNPTVTATLNGVPVTNGLIVKLIGTHRHTDVDTDDGMLKIKAPSFTLNVTATDASNNTGTGTATYTFPAREHDDDGIHRGNDMTDNHVDHGRHKSEGKTKIEHRHDR